MSKPPEDEGNPLSEETLHAVTGGFVGDTAYVGNRQGNDSFDLSRMPGMPGWGNFHIQAFFDAVPGESGNDTVTGSSGNDTIETGGGDNLAAGGAGGDLILAEGGRDTLSGGAGRDTISAGAGADLLEGGTGADSIEAGAGDDRIVWREGDGNDTIRGGEHTDTLVLSATGLSPEQVLAGIRLHNWSNAPRIEGERINVQGVYGTLTIGGETIDFHGLEWIEIPKTLTGTSGQDTIVSGSMAQVLEGGDGDDVLVGGSGRDTIAGGEGQDVIVWHPGEGADRVDGGAGTDTLRIEDTGMTPQQLLAAIVPEPGSLPPRLDPDGRICLAGVTGSITIAGESIRFANLEWLVAGDYTWYRGRG